MGKNRDITVETYNRSAAELAEYFKGIGPRVEDIDVAFELAGNPVNPAVVEIGCGDGRDAQEIVPRTGSFQGVDISEKFIEIARSALPEAEFVVSDVMEYEFPENLDIVFAFASLLHLDKEEMSIVTRRVGKALRAGGIFFISLKEAPEYSERLVGDKYGQRQFYFYSPADVTDAAAGEFEAVYESHKTIGKTPWFEMALKKL